MGIKLNPQEVTENLAINSYKIIQWGVNHQDPTNPSMFILVAEGYEDDNGVFTGVRADQINLQGQEFVDLFSKMPKTNKNFYDNIKEELYGKVKEKKNLGGTIQ